MAQNEAEAKLIGIFPNFGAGQASFGVAKSYKNADNVHEIVHILRFETGFTTSFLEEGLASALGDDAKIKSLDRYMAVEAALVDGFEPWLDSSYFRKQTMAGKPTYETARFLIDYWLEKYGLEAILNMMSIAQRSPDHLQKVINASLEAPQLSWNNLQSRIKKLCDAIKKAEPPKK